MHRNCSWLLAPCLVLTALVGCSRSSDTASSSPPTGSGAQTTTTAATTGDPVQDAQSALRASYAGTFRAPPAAGPKAVPGKKVFVISCSQVLETCKVPSDAALDAAKRMGWDAQIVDGQLSDAAQAQGITQATASGADGIVLVGIDCSKVQAPLAGARSKGIEVVAIYAFDCDDPALSAPGDPLFDATVNAGPQFPTYRDVAIAWGKVKADYVIANTRGKAKVIDLVGDDYLVVHYIEQGFAQGMERCATCEVVDRVHFVQADLLSGRLRDALTTAVEQHPEATVVHAPADPLFPLAVNAATEGRKGLLRLGGEGLPSNIELIRQGLESAVVAFPHEWTGWAAADTLNRLFAGEEPSAIPDSGIGWQIVDATHNLPASGGYKAQVRGHLVDFEKAYRQVWGV